MHELTHIRAFIEVVRCGSFSAAARQVNLSTAAISRSIAKLESDVGIRLLLRTTRNICLTDAGRAYYDAGCAALDRLAEATDALVTQEAQITGTVRIAMPGMWTRTHVLPNLATFLDAHPRLNLKLSVCDTLPDLVTAGLDFGVQHSEPTDTDYIGRCIQMVRVYLVASPGYLAKRGVPATPADLAAHDCINLQLSTGPVTWRINRDPGADAHPEGDDRDEYVHEPRGRFFLLSHLESNYEAAAADLGIAVGSCPEALPLLQSGKLRVVLPDYHVIGSEPGANKIMMLYPHRRYIPLRVRVVMDFIAAMGQRASGEPFDPHEFAT